LKSTGSPLFVFAIFIDSKEMAEKIFLRIPF